MVTKRGKVGGRVKQEFGIGIYTTIYEMDGQRGSAVYHSELYSVFFDNYKGKESKKEWMCICV